MNYSFFGTCSNDHNQLFGCLSTILNQTIRPKEIILVKVPSQVYVEIRKLFINLFELSGYKDIKIEENVDFEKLYRLKKN